MWQKERLLNVALAAVPNNVEDVAWIDCDVVFAVKGVAANGKKRFEVGQHNSVVLRGAVFG